MRRPTLRDDCIRYYDAFCLLGVSRSWTQVGPESLKISEVKALLEILGIEDVNTKLKYLRLIQRMDKVEMKYHSEKMKKGK